MPADRFRCGKQIGSYLGLIPCEDSSADRRRLGHISKRGSSLLRFLLAEAAQAAVRPAVGSKMTLLPQRSMAPALFGARSGNAILLAASLPIPVLPLRHVVPRDQPTSAFLGPE